MYSYCICVKFLIITLDMIGRIFYLFRNPNILLDMSITRFGSSQLFCMNQIYGTSRIFANTQKTHPQISGQVNS